jgi:hypothetical protein
MVWHRGCHTGSPMDDVVRRGGGEAAMGSQLITVDEALATGDVTAALRAWRQQYGDTTSERRWERFADAGDAFARIARAAGSPAEAVAQARDLYMMALAGADGAGSLDGVLRVASAFADLGDDERLLDALRIACRLAGVAIRADHRQPGLGVHDPLANGSPSAPLC